MPKENVFKKIGESESRRIMRDACEQRLMVLVVNEDQELSFKAVGSGIKGEMSYSIVSSNSEENGKFFMLSFVLDGEKYFCKSVCYVHQEKLTLADEFEVYQLQRRSHVRVEIDGGVVAKFNILEVGGVKKFVEAKVLDVSAGGARLEIPKKELVLSVGDNFSGSLRLSFRNGISLDATVRNILPTKKADVSVVGVQFLYDDPLIETRLFTTVMNLSREINSKIFKG